MEPLIVNPKNKEQLNAITAFLSALNTKHTGDEVNTDSPLPSNHNWFLNIKHVRIVEKTNIASKQDKNAAAKHIMKGLFE
ncbi:DUF2683 family protein [Mucilaginibacter paludis]|nr:DUF2683 family protein [Mucilaginibacter paludis]